MYSLHGHGLITADRRSDLYADALRRTIRPGHVVVDVGTGIGLWALYACSLGAKRVIAIEPDPVIAFAIEAAQANGMSDRITFFHRPVRDVPGAELADVVVADLRDVLPFAPASITGMIDARRFLKPDGVLIPQRDTLWIAVVEAEALYRARTEPWDAARFGIDLSSVRRAAMSVPLKARFTAAELLTTPAQWGEIDYRMVSEPHVSGDLTLIAKRDGVAHGLAMWFDSQLTDDVQFSNGPDAQPLLYGQAFLPWPVPTPLAQNDRIRISLRAIHDGTDYTISVKATVESIDGSVRVRFEQSTFDAVPLVARAMDRRG